MFFGLKRSFVGVSGKGPQTEKAGLKKGINGQSKLLDDKKGVLLGIAEKVTNK